GRSPRRATSRGGRSLRSADGLMDLMDGMDSMDSNREALHLLRAACPWFVSLLLFSSSPFSPRAQPEAEGGTPRLPPRGDPAPARHSPPTRRPPRGDAPGPSGLRVKFLLTSTDRSPADCRHA
ncbi:MAG: hypothetical protein ACO38W_12155, partial [Phycisphaerales bacterium]